MKILSDVRLTSKAERDGEGECYAGAGGCGAYICYLQGATTCQKNYGVLCSEEEEYESFAPQVKTECSNYRSLASAKPPTEFDKTSLDAGGFWRYTEVCGTTPTRRLRGRGRIVSTRNSTKEELDDLSTREVLQKLFQEEELDGDFVYEVKRVIGVKPESSLTEEIIVYREPKNLQPVFLAPSTKKTSTIFTRSMEARERVKRWFDKKLLKKEFKPGNKYMVNGQRLKVYIEEDKIEINYIDTYNFKEYKDLACLSAVNNALATLQGKDSYPVYRRCEGGRKEEVRRHELDNRWVVAYNPFLLRYFNCHINVEVCSSIKAVKYLYKYLYKGHDRVSVSVNEADGEGNVDEIKMYREARWVTSPEALWRIYGFDLSKNSPPVMQLQLHLPGTHMVTYEEGQDIQEILDREGAEKSMLTEYFEANKKSRAGAISFEELRTVDGEIKPSFREAAERRGLIEVDNTLDDCLTEAETFQMPSSLRRLFATILVYCEASNDIKSYPLPEINEEHDSSHAVDREIYEESIIEVDPDHDALATSLNAEQRSAYDEILVAMDSGEGGVFFVDGPEGTGKTFLYKALLATVRGMGNIAVVTATSGVAASIMPGGRTAHSRFKIPLTIYDGVSCSFTKQSGIAKLLKEASLIIWDEATMTRRQAVAALDNSMRDILNTPDRPFGGKTVVFGGDFRQVLPVIRKGSRAQIVDASLRRLYLWESMRHLKLVHNMRAQSDPWFAEYLLRVGNGTEEDDGYGYIRLLDEICVPYTGKDTDLHRLTKDAFPMLDDNMTDPNYITSRAILSMRNDCVDRINMRMIHHFQGEEMVVMLQHLECITIP
ncbi:hypothetical protein U9M48_024586 [Paspalum notatum var. saurae]|uniref:ATP-dependent DNA helicase n=1 Tax=Paspalum notatum var. saurae TaxID=547442 RepID=A0AAQ3TR19_PASNO